MESTRAATIATSTPGVGAVLAFTLIALLPELGFETRHRQAVLKAQQSEMRMLLTHRKLLQSKAIVARWAPRSRHGTDGPGLDTTHGPSLRHAQMVPSIAPSFRFAETRR